MYQLFVEGRGENQAAQKLIQKIISYYQLGNHHFSEGRRMAKLHTNEGVEKAIALARLNPATQGVIIMIDGDDDCPKLVAPQKAAFIRSLQAPFPVGYCIMHRQFESLFVAYAQHFAGSSVKHAIRGELQFEQQIPAVDPETVRGAKEFITRHLKGNQTYKPTTDQLTLTQALDVELLEKTELPCFGSLVRCVTRVVVAGGPGVVFPD